MLRCHQMLLRCILLFIPCSLGDVNLSPWPSFCGGPQKTCQSPFVGPVTGVAVLWELQFQDSLFASPILGPNGTTLYIGSLDYSFVAVDTASGLPLFNFSTEGSIKSTAALVGDSGGDSGSGTAEPLLVFGGEDGHVRALNCTTGEQHASYNARAPIVSPISARGNQTFFGSLGGAAAPTLFSWGASGHLAWSVHAGASVVGSPAQSHDGGLLFWGTNEGALLALRAASGVRAWEFLTNGAIVSTPSVGYLGGSSSGAGEVVYCGSSDGSLYALHATNGTLVWAFNTSGALLASPGIRTASDSAVVFGSQDGSVYCLAGDSGEVLWTTPTSGAAPVTSSPTIGGDGTVYIGDDSGVLYALENSTGAVLWTYQTGAAIVSSPALAAQGVLYLGSLDGTLSALVDSRGRSPTPSPTPSVLPRPPALPPSPQAAFADPLELSLAVFFFLCFAAFVGVGCRQSAAHREVKGFRCCGASEPLPRRGAAAGSTSTENSAAGAGGHASTLALLFFIRHALCSVLGTAPFETSSGAGGAGRPLALSLDSGITALLPLCASLVAGTLLSAWAPEGMSSALYAFLTVLLLGCGLAQSAALFLFDPLLLNFAALPGQAAQEQYFSGTPSSFVQLCNATLTGGVSPAYLPCLAYPCPSPAAAALQLPLFAAIVMALSGASAVGLAAASLCYRLRVQCFRAPSLSSPPAAAREGGGQEEALLQRPPSPRSAGKESRVARWAWRGHLLAGAALFFVALPLRMGFQVQRSCAIAAAGGVRGVGEGYTDPFGSLPAALFSDGPIALGLLSVGLAGWMGLSGKYLLVEEEEGEGDGGAEEEDFSWVGMLDDEREVWEGEQEALARSLLEMSPRAATTNGINSFRSS